MIVTIEPSGNIPATIPETPELLSTPAAAPAEMHVSIPKDDPEKIINGLQDYDNSLHALLKKNDG